MADPPATRDGGRAPAWTDGKRYLWLVALTMPMLPFAALGLQAWTGWGIWLWLGPIVILGLVPLLDLAAGLDRSNPPDGVIAALERDRYYRWLTFAFLPLQYAGFVVAFWYIATAGLDVAGKVGLAVTVGFVAGLGINTAHELGHKRESHERWLAKVALAQSFYGHFYIEHNRGHHVRVATPPDPASSRLGESFYAFWPRTVLGSLASAWRLEQRRYRLRGRGPLRPGNDVLNAWLMSVLLWAAMIAWLGAGIVPYLVIQALVGLTLLEAVNYLEHYGMLRQIVGVAGKERYERVDPTHSWNSNNIATNVLLYHLQRHSDHHANPTRRYQALRDDAGAPALPTGYAGMILLALVPPAWRRVMDPRVVAHYSGDVTRANIQPRRAPRSWRAIPGRGAARRHGMPGSSRSTTVPGAGPSWSALLPVQAAGTCTTSRSAPRARACRRGRPGPPCRTTGAARTAACGRRSTSSRGTRRRHEACCRTAAGRDPPAHRRDRDRTDLRARLVGPDDGDGRRGGGCQPPDGLQRGGIEDAPGRGDGPARADRLPRRRRSRLRREPARRGGGGPPVPPARCWCARGATHSCSPSCPPPTGAADDLLPFLTTRADLLLQGATEVVSRRLERTHAGAVRAGHGAGRRDDRAPGAQPCRRPLGEPVGDGRGGGYGRPATPGSVSR